MSDNQHYELNRGVLHIGGSLALIILNNYFNPTTIASYLLLLVLIIETSRLKSSTVNNLILNHRYSFLKKIFRHHEVDNFSAAAAFACGFFIISWLPLIIVQTTLAINGLADPAARFFGKRFGTKKIGQTNKSWVGSFAFLLCALVVTLLNFNFWPAVAVAVVGAIGEAVPDKGWLWVDNFRIPAFVGSVLWLLS